MELAQVHDKTSLFSRDRPLRFKLTLHVVTPVGLLGGRAGGGMTCVRVGFRTFYLASSLLGLILLHDLLVLPWPRLRSQQTVPRADSRERQGM